MRASTTAALVKTAPPDQRPLVEKMLAFAEYSARNPKSYDEINRRYVALIAELLPALGKNDFELALELVGSTYRVWYSVRYHGGLELDAPVVTLYTDLVAAYPDEPLPYAMLARVDIEASLDDRAGLAAAKHCIEHVARAEPQFRDEIEKECRRLHALATASLTAPHCAAVRGDLVIYRAGPRKSELTPTMPVVVDGKTFYRQTEVLVDSSHLSTATLRKATVQLQLDAAGRIPPRSYAVA